MQANSRQVITQQTAPHEHLIATLRKHQQYPFQKPIAAHTQQAFERLLAMQADYPTEIMMDSCCGTGFSSDQLGERYPHAWVIGIDRSIKRLQRRQGGSARYVTLVQADCIDLWRLAHQAKWQLSQHYLLYPNPYPKASQLTQRWHAHPVWQDLLALGGRLELRTNWRVYMEEFLLALQHSGYAATATIPFQPEQYLTLFERKYAQSGHELYRCWVNLNVN